MDFDKATKIKKLKNPLGGEVKVIRVAFVDSSGTKVSLDIPMKEANADYLFSRIKNSTASIKSILLNHKIISGSGYIYA